jgi:cytoskeletal protein CcmA (bactofilin family)
MSELIIPNEITVHSIIGEGTKFRGEFDLKGLLRIDGDFSGVIRTQDKILISRNGRAECTIYSRVVVIGGLVKGDIFASERVEILSTGVVIGNIETPRLIVQDDVILHGKCNVVKVKPEKRVQDDEENKFEEKDTDEPAPASKTEAVPASAAPAKLA